MATLAQLRTRVLANMDRGGASSTEQGYVDGWINQTIREDIEAVHNWDFMEHQETVASVADQEDYSFPDSSSGELFKDCRHIYFRTVSTEDYWELEEISLRALLQNFTAQTTGYPAAWARIGENKFRVRLIPDASTYTFLCLTWEYLADLSADGDSNTLTVSYPRLVELGATARGFLYTGELTTAQYWAGLFAQALREAIRTDKIRLAPDERTLKLSGSAGRPSTGLRRGTRWRTSPFSWWT